jgi:hypothetical protein
LTLFLLDLSSFCDAIQLKLASSYKDQNDQSCVRQVKYW